MHNATPAAMFTCPRGELCVRSSGPLGELQMTYATYAWALGTCRGDSTSVIGHSEAKFHDQLTGGTYDICKD